MVAQSTIENPHLLHPKVNAIVVNAGINLLGSIELAARIWNDDTIGAQRFDRLLVTGHHGKKRCDDTYSKEALVSRFRMSRLEQVDSQGFTFHTGTQAAWVAEQMHSGGYTGAIVIAPSFHLARFYATIVEAMRRKYGDEEVFNIPLWPMAVKEDMNAPILLDVGLEKVHGESDDPTAYCNLTPLAASFGEHARINTYSVPKADGSAGDVATPVFLGHCLQMWQSSPR